MRLAFQAEVTVPTVLFDIDGTLIFLRGTGRRAMDLAIRETWGLEEALEGISFAGGTDSAISRRVGDGRPREPMWSCYQRHLARLLDDERPRPLPGVVALLDRLEARGARLALLTGNMRGGARIKLAAAGLVERFDFALSAFAVAVHEVLANPVESAQGLGLVAIGAPVFYMWNRVNRRGAVTPGAQE